MYAAIVMNSPKLIGSERAGVMTVAMPSTTTTITPVPASSQNPARVSRALRNSTATNRAKGARVVAER